MSQPVYSPIIVFALVGLIELVLVLNVNLRHSATVTKIRRLYAKEGKRWNYPSDIKLVIKIFRDPAAIFDAGDSPEIRAAKEELVRVRLRMRELLPLILGIVAAGFVLCILAGIVELFIRESVR